MWALTEKGLEIIKNGSSPEKSFYDMIPDDGIKPSSIDNKEGFAMAMRNKWVKLDKNSGKIIKLKNSDLTDTLYLILKNLVDGVLWEEEKDIEILLKKRGMILLN